jgi:hypothetical protein
MTCVYLAQMLFIAGMRQSVYDVHKVHTPLPGRCVSAGTLLRNYCATNTAPTPPLAEEETSLPKTQTVL